MQDIQFGAGMSSAALHTADVITGTSGNDILSGGDGADTIKGLGGDDDVSAFGGDDSVYGGAGDDTLHGGAGNDLLDGGDGSDQLEASSGNDTLLGGAGDDQLGYYDSDAGFEVGGDKTLDGGAGIDWANFYDESETGVRVSLDLQAQAQDTGRGLVTLSGIENLSGTSWADALTGDGGANLIDGGGGGDTINGGGGDDGIFLYLGDTPSQAIGGAGEDAAIFDNSFTHPDSFTIDLTKGGLQDTGAGWVSLKMIEDVSTGAIDDDTADTLIGNKLANKLAGSEGDDHLIGNAGADLLLGDGYIGYDRSTGSSTVLHIDPWGFGSGWDTLEGGAGNDTLIGGQGKDMMTGGGGKDTFTFLSVEDSHGGNLDLIVDLEKRDHVDVSGIDADQNTDGDQAFRIVSDFTHHAGEIVREYDSGAKLTHFLFDVNGDGNAEMDVTVKGDFHTFANFVL